jgi:hypothetical protein
MRLRDVISDNGWKKTRQALKEVCAFQRETKDALLCTFGQVPFVNDPES